MAKLENVECNQEVRVAVKEIVDSTSFLRQAKSELLVMVRTLLYYMSVCKNSENGCRRPDTVKRNIIAAGKDVGKESADNDEEGADGKKTQISEEEADSTSNEAGCWSIEIIEEELEEDGTCLGPEVDYWLSIFIYFSMLVLVGTLIVLFLTHGGAKLKQ